MNQNQPTAAGVLRTVIQRVATSRRRYLLLRVRTSPADLSARLNLRQDAKGSRIEFIE